jgi:hypothetical protein
MRTRIWPSLLLTCTLMGFAISAAFVAQPTLAVAAGSASLGLAGRLAQHVLPDRTRAQRGCSRKHHAIGR